MRVRTDGRSGFGAGCAEGETGDRRVSTPTVSSSPTTTQRVDRKYGAGQRSVDTRGRARCHVRRPSLSVLRAGARRSSTGRGAEVVRSSGFESRPLGGGAPVGPGHGAVDCPLLWPVGGESSHVSWRPYKG